MRIFNYVQVDGGRLYYEVNGDGHPLVLVHAGFLDCRMWNREFELYAKKYKIIRYDVRGYGRSSLGTDKYSDSEDLYTLLRHLGIKNTYLLGISNGGRIALDFITAHPEMVDAMILIAPGIRGYEVSGPEEEKLWDEFDATMKSREEAMEKAVKERRLEDAARMDADYWASATTGQSRQLLLEIAIDNAHTQAEPPWKIQISPQPSAFKRLSVIKAPTLLIVGDKDELGSQLITKRLTPLISGAKMVILQGADHIANMSKPEEFDRTVLEFLESASQGLKTVHAGSS